MSKVKKYLLMASGILMLIWAGFAAFLAVKAIINPKILEDLAISYQADHASVTLKTAKWIMWCGASFLTSSALISLVFGMFAMQYSFYTPTQFENKRSIILTMAALSIIFVNIIIGPVFLTAVLLIDKNYRPQIGDLEVSSLEEQLKKLETLKNKNLISNEEYEGLRNKLLGN